MQRLEEVETTRFDFNNEAVVFKRPQGLIAVVLEEKILKFCIVAEDNIRHKVYEENGLKVDIHVVNRSSMQDRKYFENHEVDVNLEENPIFFLQDTAKLCRMYGISLGVCALRKKYSNPDTKDKTRHYFPAGIYYTSRR